LKEFEFDRDSFFPLKDPFDLERDSFWGGGAFFCRIISGDSEERRISDSSEDGGGTKLYGGGRSDGRQTLSRISEETFFSIWKCKKRK